MHRIYCPHFQLGQKVFSLEDHHEIHHCYRVLRISPGDKVAFFNGQGVEGVAVIQSASSKLMVLEVQDVCDHKNQDRLKIILACAIPKNAKFDDIVDKCTQCGVDVIIPLMTEHSEVLLKGERAQKKLERYNAIALSAAKQSHRAFLPQIFPITHVLSLPALLSKEAVIMMPYLGGVERITLKQAFQRPLLSKELVFMIGPEGDFSSGEVNAFLERVIPVDLGKNILRVDTAAITVVSVANQMLR